MVWEVDEQDPQGVKRGGNASEEKVEEGREIERLTLVPSRRSRSPKEKLRSHAVRKRERVLRGRARLHTVRERHACSAKQKRDAAE